MKDLKEIVKQYHQEHPELQDSVLKAWYAWLAPHWFTSPDMPLHNFTSSQRWSKCVNCGRSREDVRYDDLSPRCLKHVKPTPIEDVLREEEKNFSKLIERAKTFVPKFIEKNKLSGDTLAILHHTHGYEPETVATVCGVEISIHMADYQIAMEEERARSRASQKKEIIVAKTT
jgi:hypothetical protein